MTDHDPQDGGWNSSRSAILEIIEKIWKESGAWPKYIEAMRLALYSKSPGGRDPLSLAILPGLCCQAAGGLAGWADPVAASWLLFYTAAHLMDSLEDQDEPDAWWAEGGPGLALNVATGLFFSANLALQELSNSRLSPEITHTAVLNVLRPFLAMSSGQYADFIAPPASLDQYWQIAGAKSGVFFALACHSGAILAGADPDRTEGFRQFGLNVGVIIQILDDLEDYRDLVERRQPVDAESMLHSLLSVYIIDVCDSQTTARFHELLDQAADGFDAAGEITQMIENNGGVFYLMAEMDQRRHLALQGLNRGEAMDPARSYLVALLDRLAELR